ncbi:hypothetical protein FRB99_006992 [Tulasnella sp. 403]|nr:hypothetical protein FRB99_006992 [Tulasnella sp. 403]
MVVFKGYLRLSPNLSPEAMALHSELQSSGISLIHYMQLEKEKDVVGKMILADMFAFALDNQPPAVIVLISDNRDFVYAISALRHRHYAVVLLAPSGDTHGTLRTQASEVVEWSHLFSSTPSDGSHLHVSEKRETCGEGEDSVELGNRERNVAEAGVQCTPKPAPPTTTMASPTAPDLQEGTSTKQECEAQPAKAPSPQPALALTSTGSGSNSSDAVPSPAVPKAQKAKPIVPEAFWNLVSILEAARLRGITRLSTHDVAQALPQRKKSYEQAGVSKFKPWLEQAEAAGIVELSELQWNFSGWVSLREAYKGL